MALVTPAIALPAVEAAAWIIFHGSPRADRERALAPHLPPRWNNDRVLCSMHEAMELANVDTAHAIISEHSPELAVVIVAAGVALWHELSPARQDQLIHDLLQAEAMPTT